MQRRHVLQTLAGTLAAPALKAAPEWPPQEGATTPRLLTSVAPDLNEAGMRHLKQIGINYVMFGGTPAPWKEADLRARMNRFKAGGLQVINSMLLGINDVIWGRPGADAQIANFIECIRVAAKVGLPVIEYNFYAHRLTEGYKEEAGRGGAGMTAYDYEVSKNLPPFEGVGKHTRAQQLKRAEHFLKAVIPEAEKAGVRLALHPNDPPVPISRGSEQLMSSLEQWKAYLNLVKSPHNGMTFDCGVTREMGEDPVAVCRYLSERDCINHVHFRNVRVRKPHIDYTEVFPDEGQVNMFAVMKELIKHKYPRGLYPEHPRLLDMDRDANSRSSDRAGAGGRVGEVYNIAYAKAMLQAALSQ